MSKTVLQDFCGTANKRLGALASLDVSLFTSSNVVQFGSILGCFRDLSKQNQSLSEDPSQNGFHQNFKGTKTTFCTPDISSGKPKRKRSSGQAQFGSKNKPAALEPEKILANRNNNAIFYKKNYPSF